MPRYVSEVTVNPTPLSNHNLVDVQLGFKMINNWEKESGEADSFRADYQEISRTLANMDWMLLWKLCDGDLNSFLESFLTYFLRSMRVH